VSAGRRNVPQWGILHSRVKCRLVGRLQGVHASTRGARSSFIQSKLSLDDVTKAWPLETQPQTKQHKRIADKARLDAAVVTQAGHLLHQYKRNPRGKELDKSHLGKENFVVVKSAIDRQINELVGKRPRQRHEFTQPELDKIQVALPDLVKAAEQELFHA
jgi:hypothetical protein